MGILLFCSSNGHDFWKRVILGHEYDAKNLVHRCAFFREGSSRCEYHFSPIRVQIDRDLMCFIILVDLNNKISRKLLKKQRYDPRRGGFFPFFKISSRYSCISNFIS